MEMTDSVIYKPTCEELSSMLVSVKPSIDLLSYIKGTLTWVRADENLMFNENFPFIGIVHQLGKDDQDKLHVRTESHSQLLDLETEQDRMLLDVIQQRAAIGWYMVHEKTWLETGLKLFISWCQYYNCTEA